MSKQIHIVVNPETGARLCKDQMWRGFAMFGTFSCCVKFYRSLGWAQRAADKCRVNGKTKIVSMNDGDTMDASGKVTKVT
jgi:hypothetical protein